MPLPSEILNNKFPHEATSTQKSLFKLFDKFIDDKPGERSVLLIKGYAGTGKTSLVTAFVKTLPLFNLKTQLMAPTGRAAKVLSGYALKSAYTIHKKIYRQVADPFSGELIFERQKNKQAKTIFIVDEASMISEDTGFGTNSLLYDLLTYVFEKPTNKLILLGDTAQLPPVGQERSAALDTEYLKSTYKLKLSSVELTEVMRQELNSGILTNATILRELLRDDKLDIKYKTSGFNDVFRMAGDRLEDGIRYAYDKFGVDQSIIICRSNKGATQYNNLIRRQIHFFDDEICVGDMLMVVKNNYQYKSAPSGFIANGDFLEIRKVIGFEDFYDLRFADLEVRLSDYKKSEPFEVKVMLDSLYYEGASMDPESYKSFYHKVLHDYMSYSEKERSIAMKNDPYLNALQIKFAYALTCHKSQGGQWDAVFVDQGYLKEDMINHEYIRWLYTAISRAGKELYLINFDARFF